MSAHLSRFFPIVCVAAVAAILAGSSSSGALLAPAHAFELPSIHTPYAPLGFGEAGIDLSYAIGVGVLRSIALAAAVGVTALPRAWLSVQPPVFAGVPSTTRSNGRAIWPSHFPRFFSRWRSWQPCVRPRVFTLAACCC